MDSIEREKSKNDCVIKKLLLCTTATATKDIVVDIEKGSNKSDPSCRKCKYVISLYRYYDLITHVEVLY